jgi:hypothetical protein
LWFATIQCIESKQDLSDSAPKDCFIPAKAVERVAGQISQTQKAMCETQHRNLGGEAVAEAIATGNAACRLL